MGPDLLVGVLSQAEAPTGHEEGEAIADPVFNSAVVAGATAVEAEAGRLAIGRAEALETEVGGLAD